ncbi:MAG TPA: bifunctional DNA-formamidopyrimidine glycosylase/DNA-(apurinic or apyrimidinic site) lyase [Acidimicrobiia bacterium]|nr:bifunctional DNA-formamidopyrimidine glycosylase/DNA-(apurinic or apyrimidinic site) lyase [Acidimicrobiia bacterium]
MPELPEVELTRRHLETALLGRVFTDVTVSHERTARHNTSPGEVEERLKGRRVASVGRHGKFLRLDLDDGQVMVAHLGMSGRWSLGRDEEIPHTHFVGVLDDGTAVRFVDPRTFGFVAVYDEEDLLESGLGRLGPDAWADPPTPLGLIERLAGRTAPMKALLLDQGPIAGLGNIYADEVLFRSRIHPLTPGGELDEDDASRMLAATREVLDAAIDSGGTTLDDLAYLLPDGQAGENSMNLKVYGREGEPCEVCGTPIERLVVRARSTHFCPVCQARR